MVIEPQLLADDAEVANGGEVALRLHYEHTRGRGQASEVVCEHMPTHLTPHIHTSPSSAPLTSPAMSTTMVLEPSSVTS